MSLNTTEELNRDNLNMDRWNIVNVATAVANMMDGLLDGRKFNEITEAWDMGFLELTQHLAHVAIYGEEKIMSLEPEQDFPGVYDYEVSHWFGAWFGEMLLSQGDTSLQACYEKLDELRNEFFDRSNPYLVVWSSSDNGTAGPWVDHWETHMGLRMAQMKYAALLLRSDVKSASITKPLISTDFT